MITRYDTVHFGWKLNVWKKNSLKTKCLKKDFEKEEGWKKTRRSNDITTKEAKPMKKVSRYFSYFFKYWHINENYCSISILPSQSKILEEPGVSITENHMKDKLSISFRKNIKGCLLLTLERWKKCIDINGNGKACIILLLTTSSKTFDFRFSP